MPICTQCGDEFQPKSKTGRPRSRCTKCSPERSMPRTNKPGASSTSTTYHGGQNNASTGLNPVGTDTPGASHSPPSAPGVHCAWCGTFTSNGAAFCNPAHRALFSQKIADTRNGGESVTLSEAKKRNKNREHMRSVRDSEKRPLQRARDQRDTLIAQSKIKKAQRGIPNG